MSIQQQFNLDCPPGYAIVNGKCVPTAVAQQAPTPTPPASPAPSGTASPAMSFGAQESGGANTIGPIEPGGMEMPATNQDARTQAIQNLRRRLMGAPQTAIAPRMG